MKSVPITFKPFLVIFNQALKRTLTQQNTIDGWNKQCCACRWFCSSNEGFVWAWFFRVLRNQCKVACCRLVAEWIHWKSFSTADILDCRSILALHWISDSTSYGGTYWILPFLSLTWAKKRFFAWQNVVYYPADLRQTCGEVNENRTSMSFLSWIHNINFDESFAENRQGIGINTSQSKAPEISI